MTDRIYLVSDSEELRPMDQQRYDSESLLQRLLAAYPDLLAGEQIDEHNPRRWLLVRREMRIPGGEDQSGGRWSVDHLFLDQDGVPTLVEVKRSTDTRIRREVVGQMLDYAANAVVYWPAERIRSEFESSQKLAGADPYTTVSDFLNVIETDDYDDADDENRVEAFWKKVESNLQAERIRLVFVADDIPDELARIVEFLNGQMYPADVFALEVKQFVGEGNRIMVPKLIGWTEKSKAQKTIATETWDSDRFLSHISQGRGPDTAALTGKILNWSESWSDGIQWSTSNKPWCYPWIWLDQANKRYFAPFRFNGKGELRVQFRNLRPHPPFDQEELREELFDRLNQIDGISLPDGCYRELSAVFPVAVLQQQDAYNMFIRVWEWGNDIAKRHYIS